MNEISTDEIISRLKELIVYFENQKKLKIHDEEKFSDTFIP